MDKQKKKRIPLYIFGNAESNNYLSLVFWLIFLIGIIALFLFAFSNVQAWSVRAYGELIKAIVYIGFFFFAFVILLRAWGRKYIAIYENGIEYGHRSKVIFSSWDNLNNFEVRVISGRSNDSYQTFLVLFREAEILSDANWFDSWALQQHSTFFIPLYSTLDIPIKNWGLKNDNKPVASVNLKALQETEFGQYLLKYAPQLFEESEEKSKNE
jgi:hypothetical protein